MQFGFATLFTNDELLYTECIYQIPDVYQDNSYNSADHNLFLSVLYGLMTSAC